jgi:simple sugar transport system permease protein
MRRTYFGLRLRAVGLNPRAAHVLGIPARRQLLSAFALCGLLAGLAGAMQVVGLFHRLIPNISSNLGYLALLVVMLVNFDPIWILPIAFFFSALNIGSLQLPLSLQLESSLAGVIQGLLVLFALLGRGLAQRYGRSTT